MTALDTPPQELRVGDSRTESRALKILHVFDHSVPMLSGYSIRSLAILHEQRRRGWRTAHLTTPKHTAEGVSPEHVNDLLFYRSRPLARAAATVPYLRELALIGNIAREIERVAAIETPDILHAHSPALNGIAALMAARRLRLPVVYEVRAFWEDAAVDQGTGAEGGLRYRLTRALETFVLRRCAAAATICEGLRRDIVERGIASDKITVIANGVRIEEFPFRDNPNAALKSALGLDDRIVFGFLGSFYAYEGLDLLLSAMPAVLQLQPGAVLLLVGGGPVEAALKEQASRMGLGDSVRFLGRIPHEQIQEYYNAVDIFVYPRHRMRLTDTVTPLKPLEAMAQGGVVLASDVGGHCELIVNGENGRLFRADDKDALASAMLSLIADRAQWEEIRRNARQFVERERTWTATTAGYREIYTRALNVRAPANARISLENPAKS